MNTIEAGDGVNGTDAESVAYAYAGGIVATTLGLTIMHHVAFLAAWRLGQVLQSTTIALVFRKALVVSQKSLAEITTGHVINLVSAFLAQAFVSFVSTTHSPTTCKALISVPPKNRSQMIQKGKAFLVHSYTASLRDPLWSNTLFTIAGEDSRSGLELVLHNQRQANRARLN